MSEQELRRADGDTLNSTLHYEKSPWLQCNYSWNKVPVNKVLFWKVKISQYGLKFHPAVWVPLPPQYG